MTGGNHGPTDSATSDLVAARSFVVRALLERDGTGQPAWHGFVTDAETGQRQAWRRTRDLVRFIERHLTPVAGAARIRAAVMGGPALTEVVTDMLAVLGTRLPAPVPALPDPNVTLERVTEKLVGLGNQRGAEPTGTIGFRTLRGGRLDARVRFQLWGPTAPAVDTAVLTLHSDLLDDTDALRQAGFLKLAASQTTLAEPVESVDGWRKATSFDVLYEYRYVDTDDADSLIAAIPVTTDPERVGSPDREQQTVTDELVRWDDEAAPDLVVRGPATIDRLSALAFAPAPAFGGTVTVRRGDGTAGPVVHLPDLAAFLAATSGDVPAATNADVTLSPGDFLAALGPAGTGIELGDWDTDGTTDAYAGFDRLLVAIIELPAWTDTFTISYSGPATGLDQTGVVYLRVNAP